MKCEKKPSQLTPEQRQLSRRLAAAIRLADGRGDKPLRVPSPVFPVLP